MTNTAEYNRAYYLRNRERLRARGREYGQRPEVKERRRARLREYGQRPEVKARKREAARRYYHAHREEISARRQTAKAEKQGGSA